jgi:DNA processing protein
MLVYDIALTLIPEIGNIRGRRLIEVFGSAEAALKTSLEDLAEQSEIPFAAIRNIELSQVFPAAEAEIKYMEKHGIEALPITDPRYPARLKECPDAPLILYVKGNLNFNTPRWLSVVGTRKVTAYGRKITAEAIDGLSRLSPETVIVSGLAYGTDIEAHLSALRAGMTTVAVLGNPLGYVYPEAHTGYAEEIVEKGGALVSEFHSRCEVRGSNFLRRNRIIAGLCDGTLVVESAYRGGSLSTAACALGYFRDVMAVPGRVGDPMSEGTNRLIRDNRAAMVLQAQDILNALNWDASPAKSTTPTDSQTDLFAVLNNSQADFFAPPTAGQSGFSAPPPALTREEALIFEQLKQGGSLSADELSVRTGMPAATISALTLSLEIDGLIRRLPGNLLEIV